MSDPNPCNCDQTLELMEALDSVLSAATEPGHQLSDTEICDAIDWQGLREIVAKYKKTYD